MHERKRIMFERSDAFVALPGGIGTLEELVEMMTWAQLGRHRKPVLIANINGFWDPLIVLLRHMADAGFIRNGFEVNYIVANTADEIVPKLLAAPLPRRFPPPTRSRSPISERPAGDGPSNVPIRIARRLRVRAQARR
jgi:predicted Rossmann-fold nucleotide-binding protein